MVKNPAATATLAEALDGFEASMTIPQAERLATASMRLALACFAWLQVKTGKIESDSEAGAAMLLHLADHLAPVQMAA